MKRGEQRNVNRWFVLPSYGSRASGKILPTASDVRGWLMASIISWVRGLIILYVMLGGFGIPDLASWIVHTEGGYCVKYSSVNVEVKILEEEGYLNCPCI